MASWDFKVLNLVSIPVACEILLMNKKKRLNETKQRPIDVGVEAKYTWTLESFLLEAFVVSDEILSIINKKSSLFTCQGKGLLCLSVEPFNCCELITKLAKR